MDPVPLAISGNSLELLIAVLSTCTNFAQGVEPFDQLERAFGPLEAIARTDCYTGSPPASSGVVSVAHSCGCVSKFTDTAVLVLRTSRV